MRHESFRVDADRLLAAIEPILHTDVTVGPHSSVAISGRAQQIKTEPGTTTSTRLDEQQFLRSLDNDEYRQALRGLFDVAKDVGLVVEWGSMGSAASTPSVQDALSEYVNAVRLVPGAMRAKARTLHAYTFAPEAVCAQQDQLERVGDLLDLTSKRIGFAGRGFGTTSAAKRLALEAGVAGAASIPDRAQLMMGFTSTQPDALGPDNIVSFETLKGVTDQWPSGYFAHGCAMHLSHLNLDIVSWYAKSYADRVQRMFSPSTTVMPADGTVTVPNGAAQVVTLQQVKDQAAQGLLGHNSALQPATRLGADVVDNYGRLRKKGSAVPEREDFNTLDDPFSWYVENGTVQQPTPNRPGLHFAVFVPTSNKFHIARSSMDGVMPDGTDLRVRYGLTDEQIGFNKEMEATHRQNYLVPPRAHRSFPLAELL